MNKTIIKFIAITFTGFLLAGCTHNTSPTEQILNEISQQIVEEDYIDRVTDEEIISSLETHITGYITTLLAVDRAGLMENYVEEELSSEKLAELTSDEVKQMKLARKNRIMTTFQENGGQGNFQLNTALDRPVVIEELRNVLYSKYYGAKLSINLLETQENGDQVPVTKQYVITLRQDDRRISDFKEGDWQTLSEAIASRN